MMACGRLVVLLLNACIVLHLAIGQYMEMPRKKNTMQQVCNIARLLALAVAPELMQIWAEGSKQCSSGVVYVPQLN